MSTIGYVYVLENPRAPGLVKVGRTDNVDRRVSELNSHAGVAGRWKCSGYVAVSDCVSGERLAHRALSSVWDGDSGGNEMFMCSVDHAGFAIFQALSSMPSIEIYTNQLPQVVKEKAARLRPKQLEEEAQAQRERAQAQAERKKQVVYWGGLLAFVGLLSLVNHEEKLGRAEKSQSAAPPAAQASPNRTVASFVLGNSVYGGNALGGPPMTTFDPRDTIYALVTTNSTSAKPATISARWFFEDVHDDGLLHGLPGIGSLVNESRSQLAEAGRRVTEFHISKPDGWPLGTYSVVIRIDGEQVAGKSFEVKVDRFRNVRALDTK